MHDVPAEFDDPLERSGHVLDAKLRKREPVARPAPPLVQPERRPVGLGLQALALRSPPLVERQSEQPFPELPRPREVIGRKLDQIDRRHPFSLCRLRRLAATVGP